MTVAATVIEAGARPTTAQIDELASAAARDAFAMILDSQLNTWASTARLESPLDILERYIVNAIAEALDLMAEERAP